MERSTFCALFFGIFVSTGLAVPTIQVMDTAILPEPNQPVQVRILDAPFLEGINLYLQMGDGGDLTAYGMGAGQDVAGVTAPGISGLDARTGTVFENNSSGWNRIFIYPSGGIPNPLWAVACMTTAQDTVDASDALFATIYLDASGLPFGTSSVLTPDTNLVASDLLSRFDPRYPGLVLPTTCVAGTITVIPEPVALGVVLWSFGILRRRSRC